MSTWVFKTQKYLQDLKSIQSKKTHTVAVTEHKTHKNKNKPMYEITDLQKDYILYTQQKSSQLTPVAVCPSQSFQQPNQQKAT